MLTCIASSSRLPSPDCAHWVSASSALSTLGQQIRQSWVHLPHLPSYSYRKVFTKQVNVHNLSVCSTLWAKVLRLHNKVIHRVQWEGASLNFSERKKIRKSIGVNVFFCKYFYIALLHQTITTQYRNLVVASNKKVTFYKKVYECKISQNLLLAPEK